MPTCRSVVLALAVVASIVPLGARQVIAGPASIARTPSIDGVWSQLPTPGRRHHTAIIDPVRDEMVLFGGEDPGRRGDVWAFPLSGVSAWEPRPTGGISAQPRDSHSAVYDPVRKRMIVFGGTGDSGGLSVSLNSVIALDLTGLPTWSAVAPAGTPPSPRSAHAAVYDPVRDRMIVFGGTDQSGAYIGDLWELTLSGTVTWHALSPGGATPAARAGATLVYDTARDRLLLFGGATDVDLFDDVWELPLSGPLAWHSLAISGPGYASAFHGAILDPIHDRLIVVGGWGGDAKALSLSGTPAWSSLTLPPSGSPDSPSAVYDATRNRMVVYGGSYTGFFWTVSNETAALDLASDTWTDLGPPLPERVMDHTMVLDAAGRRAVLFGGANGYEAPDRVWTLPLDDAPVWSELPASGAMPALSDHVAIYDPPRQRMLVLGADGVVSQLTLGGSPAWSTVATSGTPPSGRIGHSAVYDGASDRMVVFGGYDTALRNDVWALDLSGTPTWSTASASGTPPSARFEHSAVYDAPRNRMIVFGGQTSTQSTTLTNDVWELTLGATPHWAPLTPSGTLPGVRAHHTAVIDAANDRMLVFGGSGASLGRSDVWALALASPAWTKLAPTGSPITLRERQAAIFDPSTARMIVFGGYVRDAFDSPLQRDDTWALAFGTAAAVPVDRARSASLSLAPARPNPTRGGTLLAFSLDRAADASLAIYDLAGRHVRTLASGRLSAGEHRMRWDGLDTEGRPVLPGVYLYALRSGGERAARKLVVVE